MSRFSTKTRYFVLSVRTICCTGEVHAYFPSTACASSAGRATSFFLNVLAYYRRILMISMSHMTNLMSSGQYKYQSGHGNLPGMRMLAACAVYVGNTFDKNRVKRQGQARIEIIRCRYQWSIMANWSYLIHIMQYNT